jgi:hypothetical protein
MKTIAKIMSTTRSTSTKRLTVASHNEDFKKDERKSFIFGFKIHYPQFSVFEADHGSQILFTSSKGLLISLRQHFMQYDFYNQDPKTVICFNCDDMTIYSAPPRVDLNKRIFWADHATSAGHSPSAQCSANVAEGERLLHEQEAMNVASSHEGRRAHKAAVYRR